MINKNEIDLKEVLLRIATPCEKNDVVNIEDITNNFDFEQIPTIINEMYHLELDYKKDEDFLIELTNDMLSECLRVCNNNGKEIYFFVHNDIMYML